MGKYVACLVLALFFTSCKDNKPTPPPEPKQAEAKTEIAPSKPEVAPEVAPEAAPETAVENSPLKMKINARAEVLPPQDGFQETFDFAIGIAENNTVSGSATVGGGSIELTGALTDDSLRVWAVGDEAGVLKGGFFIGEMKDGGGTGTFALSGSGGDPNLRGTWKTL